MKKFLPLSLALAAFTLPFVPVQADDAPATDAPANLPAAPDAGNNVREVTAHYNAGLEALRKNDLAVAATEFQKAVDLAPDDAPSLMFLGYVKLRQEDYASALTSLEAAKAQSIKLDTKLQPILFNNLGIAYANSDRASDAQAAYQKALDLSGTNEYTDARYNLAFALLAKKDYKNALPHLTKLKAQRANDKAFQSSVSDGLAEAYENTGDWANAVANYKLVTQLNPNDGSAGFNYALALSKTGRLDDAITQGLAVLKLQPNHQPTLLLLGDLYSRKSDWKNAKAYLTRYVKANPDNFTAWFTLGVAYDYTADFANALDAYAQAEKLSPKDPAVQNNIGRILYKQAEKEPGKFDDSVQHLQKALALDPSFDDARVNLALVYTAQSKWDESIVQWKAYLDNLRAALQKPGLTAGDKADLKRKALSARGALAENYLKATQYPNAVKEYKALLFDSPNNLDAMSNLGLALYHTKAYPDAIGTYREVIKRDPKNYIAYNNLGVVLEASNKREEAIQNYRKALQLNPNYAEAKVNLDRLTTAT